ncbi:MAG: PAS domain-containing protein [Flavisolibacter sp.]|nr:PAS domain-containing protein [Flavisolibacter sp.]
MNKKALYLFFTSFLLFIVVVIINKKSLSSMQEYAAEVDVSREIIISLERISNYLKSAQIYTPTYEKNTNLDYYRLYRAEAESIEPELIHLQKLVKDPGQVMIVNNLAQMIRQQLPVLLEKNVAEMIQSEEVWRLRSLYDIHKLINRSIAYQKQKLSERNASLRKLNRWINVLSTLFSVIAVSLIGYVFLFNVVLSRKRRSLEDFLQSVLNTSRNGIVTYKAIRDHGKITDFRVEFANEAISELLGVNPESVIGKKLTEFSSFIREEGFLQKYVQVVETGQPAEFEIFYDRNNRRRWLNVVLAKREDGLTATFDDISELKKYEEELKKNIQQLENSNEELEQYAFAASHDLQEPLRKIRTFGSRLEESDRENLSEDGRLYLDKIMSSAERMSNLIRDILDFSSIKREDAFERTDLTEIVKDVLQDLDLLIAQKEATVEYDPLPVIEAIPAQMNQLFSNLLNNALKFSRPDVHPVIQIRWRMIPATEVALYKNLEERQSYCEITVADNGQGFEQEAAEQIFGVFKRLGGTGITGSGIGLAICRKVVMNHNGIIFAEGRVNEGAVFHILLPMEQ